MSAGLYIHVPFCERKCRYCDFYSVPLSRDEKAPTDYLYALSLELEKLPDDFRPDTIFIGGGTPTALRSNVLGPFLKVISDAVDSRRVVEWSCEINPGTIDAEKARILRDIGVNRISLGVQTLNNKNLFMLGRSHQAEQSEEAFDILRSVGFKNINIDLMYSIPGASCHSMLEDVERAISLEPEHIATYCLTFEEGTMLTKLREIGQVEEVPDEEQLDQYTWVRDMLASADYIHYEISNFAKEGLECKHNLLYWAGGQYIGCGPAAHSHWNGVRYGNIADLPAYCQKMVEGESVRVSEERLEPEAKARELLVMALRRVSGISLSAFKMATGFDCHDLRGEEIVRLCADGLLVEKGDNLRLAERALFISDTVFTELV